MEIECVLDAKALTGEGAVWDDRTETLFWVDIPAGIVHQFDPSNGSDRSWNWGEDVGCLAVREKGGLVIATRTGFHLFDPLTGTRSALNDPEAETPSNRFNDGTTDSVGRFWAGTMHDQKPQNRAGRFYRLDADFAVTPWKNEFFTTNGLAFSPDGKTMYFSDSHIDVQTIWACDYDVDNGEPHSPRTFFDCRSVAGRPDGGTVDADGCYWMAGVSGWQVVRITPEGNVDRIIDMPVERPSKPMFGGNNLETLFVTSIGAGLSEGTAHKQPQAGGLFAITGLGVKGVKQTRFPG